MTHQEKINALTSVESYLKDLEAIFKRADATMFDVYELALPALPDGMDRSPRGELFALYHRVMAAQYYVSVWRLRLKYFNDDDLNERVDEAHEIASDALRHAFMFLDAAKKAAEEETDEPKAGDTVVFYVNHAGCRGWNIESFYRSDAGAEFWRDLVAAAVRLAPEISERASHRGFESVFLPAEEADVFIQRLAEIREQNWSSIDGEEDSPLTESEQPISFYATNRPDAFETWVRRVCTSEEVNND